MIIPSFAAIPGGEKKIRLGYFPEPGMMNGAKEGEHKSGYVYEYIQELSSITGWKYEYVYGNYSDLYKMLTVGEIDMLPYITWTEARTHEVFFPDMQMGDEQFYIASSVSGDLSSDMHELDGKKIGTTKDTFWNEAFSDMFKEKDVDCELAEYPLIEEKWAALENGEIDFTIESNTVFQEAEVYSVYEFNGKYPYFMTVSPQREELLDELNYAQKYLNETNPEFLNNLKNKYFSDIPIFRKLPEEGKNWIEGHDFIVIGTYNNDAPYIIEGKDGSISGVAPDQVNLALSKLGVNIPIEWKLYPGKEQAVAAICAGEIDCINPYYHGYSDAEEDGLIISRTVYKSGFSVLYKGQYTEKTLFVVATPVTRLGASYVRDNYPGTEIVPCQDGYDCLEKLESGEATCVVMYSDALLQIASESARHYNTKDLEADCDVCFAALPGNSGLISIFNKGYPFISDAERNAIQNKYHIENEEITFRHFLKTHPECYWGLLVFLALAALVIVVIQSRISKKNELKQHELESYKKIIDQFTSSFDAVLIGNIKDGSYRVISHKRDIDNAFFGKESIDVAVREYLSKSVHPSDVGKVKEALAALHGIKERLPLGESDSLEYRSKTGDDYLWHRATLVRLSEIELMLGIKDCDEEITSRHVTEKLMDDYDAIYIVDLNRDVIRPTKSSRVSVVGDFREKLAYSRIIPEFAKNVAPKYREDWLKFGNIDYMKKYMAEENHREYVYELPGTEKKMRRFSVDVIERINGEASTVLLSFMGIDDIRAQAILLHRQMAQQKVLLNYFVDSFDSAYFVNLADDTFDILHMNHEFSDIFCTDDKRKESMLRFIDEHIHPEDRELMLKTIDPVYIRNRLNETQSFTFVVREIFGSKEKTMRGLIVRGMDEDHIAVGFLDISENIRKEKENRERVR